MSDNEQAERLTCPRCGKTLDERHIRAIGRAMLALAVFSNHLRSIEQRDFYCVECFDETEKNGAIK